MRKLITQGRPQLAPSESGTPDGCIAQVRRVNFHEWQRVQYLNKGGVSRIQHKRHRHIRFLGPMTLLDVLKVTAWTVC